MNRDSFKIMHSNIMMCFQCIEFDLKRIYSGMSADDFDDCMDMLETSNFGDVLSRLKKLDKSDNDPYLSDSDYELLDKIREMRNYWCHQCYLDYVYIQNDQSRENKFQKIARRLDNDYNRVLKLHHNLQSFYFDHFE